MPVFKEIAENMLKCFNGQKVTSDSEDSDSDSEGPGPMTEPNVQKECCSDDEDGSYVQSDSDGFHTPLKKHKLSHYHRKKSPMPSREAATNLQRVLVRDAKQSGHKDILMSPRPKCKTTPCKVKQLVGGRLHVGDCMWVKSKK